MLISPRWPGRGRTLAVYMGATTLPQLAIALRARGLDLSIPAALNEQGGTIAQRSLRGSRAEIVAQAPGWGMARPCC